MNYDLWHSLDLTKAPLPQGMMERMARKEFYHAALDKSVPYNVDAQGKMTLPEAHRPDDDFGTVTYRGQRCSYNHGSKIVKPLYHLGHPGQETGSGSISGMSASPSKNACEDHLRMARLENPSFPVYRFVPPEKKAALSPEELRKKKHHYTDFGLGGGGGCTCATQTGQHDAGCPAAPAAGADSGSSTTAAADPYKNYYRRAYDPVDRKHYHLVTATKAKQRNELFLGLCGKSALPLPATPVAHQAHHAVPGLRQDQRGSGRSSPALGQVMTDYDLWHSVGTKTASYTGPLYHFTSTAHYPVIKEMGYLKLTESNVGHHRGRAGSGLGDQRPRAQGVRGLGDGRFQDQGQDHHDRPRCPPLAGVGHRARL